MSIRMKANAVIVQLTPPILLPFLRNVYRWGRGRPDARPNPHTQHLDIYWDSEMAEVLETWGEGNAWNEIQLVMAGRSGRVLDIACGTGKTMATLSDNPGLELWGCDISDALIERAIQRGLLQERLHVGDATKLPYPDGYFDFSYSVGSIEHFTEDGIDAMLAECRRVTRMMAFHTHPVSRSGRNEGWITTVQSYFNNSVDWWLPKYRRVFSIVKVLDSTWEDSQSVGKWFICS